MEPIDTDDASAPLPSEPVIYRFGELELSLPACELRRGGRAIVLSAKSMQALVYLVRNRGRLVSRHELLAALWPATRVASGSLSQAIWEVRRALSEQPNGDRMITTLRCKGYRFDAEVTSCGAEIAWPQPLQERLSMLPTETRTIVLELATFLARHAAGLGREPDHSKERAAS